jgi:hypothetical protein
MTAIRTTDTVSSSDFGVYVFGNNTDIISASGSHLFYIGGSFDTLASTGGSEMVLATGGNNTINLSGSGNNTVYLSGGNNVINTGSGDTAIIEAASVGDRIVMPDAGTGFDAITLLPSSDPKLDFAAALRATNWDGRAASLSGYISAAPSAGVTTISLSATAHGAATAIASVANVAGATWDFSTVLAHVVT